MARAKDVLGWRRKFGVLGPSTNTIVQPDFEDLRVPGVTNHYSRIYTPDEEVNNETFISATEVIAENVTDAITRVMTCNPDYLVMGMSAITFYGGKTGAADFQKKIESQSKVGVSTGAHSCTAAMRAYGDIKRMAFVSPYYPAANEQVKRYFEEEGFTVVRDVALQCPRFTAIAEVTEEELVKTFDELNSSDVDAIVQVGTNLSMIRFAGAAETWLGKPVIAINTATYWHALRANGIKDRIYGFGKLLEDW